MDKYIYDNDPGEQNQMDDRAFNTTGESEEAEEREVIIYESSDIHEVHNAVTKSVVHQQPCRTFVRPVTVCLVLLCALLMAAIIGTDLHCRIRLRTLSESWAEERRQTLVELSHFCEDGCRWFNNSFYYISSKQKSWDDSRKDCKNRAADLVIVNSIEEQLFIQSLKESFWIGLTDREDEGTWKWVDGSVLNSTGFWKKGEPSGTFAGGKEHCVNTYWYNQLRSWNDNNCDKPQYWICEKVKSEFRHNFSS